MASAQAARRRLVAAVQLTAHAEARVGDDASLATAPKVDDATLRRVADAIALAGGTALLVGGCVRDALLGMRPKDIDIEVFGLDDAGLMEALATLGPVMRFGVSFAVRQVRGLPIDFTLPRADTFVEAARFRDLTMNSMGRDILRDVLIDPFGGADDLRARRLRATDVTTFGDDPLRALRVCQLAARFDMQPDGELIDLCAAQDLGVVASERLRLEFEKLLLLPRIPSVGLRVFAAANMTRFFPALQNVDHALVDAAAVLPADLGRESLLVAALLYRADLNAAQAWLERTRYSNVTRDTTLKLLRHAHTHAPTTEPQMLAAWMHARARRLAADDAVLGRHLLARGYQPGPDMGHVLKACRLLQDETGETDPQTLLAQVLDHDAAKAPG